MIDGGPSSEVPQDSSQPEDLPDRLRVHSLARVLGTTSRQVLDALTELDGRIRSAHSTVDRVDAVRVRDLLASAPATVAAPVVATEAGAAVEADEPESRLLLETTVERPEYMPLFVAPQPVKRTVGQNDTDAPEDTDDSDDSGDDDDFDADDSDDEQADRPANRRRRRGRRGRGRGRGDQNGADKGGEAGGDGGKSDAASADNTDDEDSDDDADDSDTAEDDNGSGEGATKRRRRRRRRKSGSGDDNDESPSPDDPPNTVVHERAPRANDKSGSGGGSSNAEIQGIDGSTRLEAKRQRRRDGRDAGRRRPPVLTEAEFLARREAVERVMVVRDTVRTDPPHPGSRYTQIAVLEDGIVVEHFVTSAASASLVGNIYLGIVQNVLPSMEAAFIDIGRGRNGVLYAGEVNWEAAGLGGANRKIEQALRPGDYVVVQVSKDPVGHKGARLTTQVSLAGRYLV
ncbi:MAG: ribonuclease, partial [Mycobacterium sp.]|nr:ribonuclease [Mycobacterium sp.]